jgi:hypothetical protein
MVVLKKVIVGFSNKLIFFRDKNLIEIVIYDLRDENKEGW